MTAPPQPGASVAAAVAGRTTDGAHDRPAAAGPVGGGRGRRSSRPGRSFGFVRRVGGGRGLLLRVVGRSRGVSAVLAAGAGPGPSGAGGGVELLGCYAYGTEGAGAGPSGAGGGRRVWRSRGERGGAVSLWVVLMVPVSAFAAVVAMAGPQRLAAESSMQEAADDLAMFTVAWRDGQTSEGPLPAFPPECAARTQQQQTELTTLGGAINSLDSADPNFAADLTALDTRLIELRDEFGLKSTPSVDKGELRFRFDETKTLLDDWDGACKALFEALLRDLGYLGIDMGSLRGSYSDSLKGSTLAQGRCDTPVYTTQAECTDARGTWTPARYAVPCWTSEATAGRAGAIVVSDAVHVALAADWGHAGWAAAQVWRDGLPMAAESIGRLSQYQSATPPEECGTQLQVLDSQGRPVWADSPVQPPSRQLVESVPRTALSN